MQTICLEMLCTNHKRYRIFSICRRGKPRQTINAVRKKKRKNRPAESISHRRFNISYNVCTKILLLNNFSTNIWMQISCRLPPPVKKNSYLSFSSAFHSLVWFKLTTIFHIYKTSTKLANTTVQAAVKIEIMSLSSYTAPWNLYLQTNPCINLYNKAMKFALLFTKKTSIFLRKSSK